jgi:hypothetical protein
VSYGCDRHSEDAAGWWESRDSYMVSHCYRTIVYLDVSQDSVQASTL